MASRKRSTFMIALVGRPNVGKSRIFNRLTASRQAIVHDYEGVTRDRQYGTAEWYGKDFGVIDTGGFVVDAEEPILQQMRDQAGLAMEEADLILMVLDGRAGMTAADHEIASLLRRDADKPVYFAVNKVDTHALGAELLADFYGLGVELYPISAEHGTGFDSLMDKLAEHIPKPSRAEDDDEGGEDEEPYARVCVIGKPNAGKSTLVNALLGEERLLTSDIPGTTRDAVDTLVRYEGREYLLIDTAGLRRKRSISEKLEEFAVIQAIRSIDRSDVALLVLDSTEGPSAQDKKIASVLVNRGCGCVILLNKWDVLPDKDTTSASRYVTALFEEMPFMDFAPVLTMSARTGQRVSKILALVDEAYEQHCRRITTSELNRFLADVQLRHAPPVHRNRRPKFYFATQVATRPPTFAFFVSYPEAVAPSYQRFLENQLRERYGFRGTPIRVLMRARRREERR